MPVATARFKEMGFWSGVAAGLRVRDAASAVMMAETTGWRIFREAGGVRPELTVPGVRLSFAERAQIEAFVAVGVPQVEIAARLDRSPATISRELARNRSQRGYRAMTAQVRADNRARRPKIAKLVANPRLARAVQDRLEQEHSPEQIARRLRREFPEDPEMWVSHETIYTSLFVQGRGALRRDLSTRLRTGRVRRRPRHPLGRRGNGQGRIPGMVNISERPAEVADRAVPGHWEGDLIMGSKASNSAIGTLVERSTRFVMLLHLPDGHGAEQVQDAMVAAITTLPAQLRKSVTWDQGKEMANHVAIAAATDLEIYFCDPHSPWQRGSNENTNGLLRQYFAKGTDLSQYAADYLTHVAEKLNNRPRETLHWATPTEAINALLSDPEKPPGVAMTG
jgi:transposase, IS30 family